MKDSDATPIPLYDGDLMAYIDGDAAPSIVAAIEADEALLAEVAALRQAQALLDVGLARGDCPETDDLLTYQAKLLQGDVMQAIATHLETCVYCQQEVAELAVGIVLDTKPVAAAESGWLDTLRLAGWRVIELALRSPTQTPAFGLRGDSQQLIFESDAYQIVAVIKRVAEDASRLEGQVVNLTDPLVMPEGQVMLRVGSSVAQSADLNQFGHFILEPIADGSYTLQIEANDFTSLIVQLALPIAKSE